MFYYANFKDINMMPFRIEINTEEGGLSEYELTLSGTPVIVKQEGGKDLFSPIKGTTCTINIESDGGLFDLYTTDPQGVKVVVTDLANANVVFRGYATPMQYEQDWTTIDTLSLECVDCVSSLKNIPYQPISGERQYKPVRHIIENCFVHAFPEDEDSIFRWFRYYWPQHNFKSANNYNFSTTREMIDNISLNEANFFDDDDQETPWSYWEVLEEICKYFCVSLVCYKGAYWFIDYLYTAATNPAVAWFWQYDLDNNYYSVSLSKSMTFNQIDYAGGTASISTDDTYNLIAVNTNRYDIDKIATDVYDGEDNHISINRKYQFGGTPTSFNIEYDNFWGTHVVDTNTSFYLNYCMLKSSTGWTHTWWSPRGNVEYWGDCYSTAMAGYSDFLTWPENKYINTIGATILHYACVDNLTTAPNSLDWKNVIMFNCLTDTIKPSSTNLEGFLTGQDIMVGTYEHPVLTYKSDYELNYSPENGTSWIVFNGALWYQKNYQPSNWSNKYYWVTQPKAPATQVMFPTDEATDAKAYVAKLSGDNGTWSAWRTINDNVIVGWPLMKFRLKIGDKYWNGTQWTTTDSTFYINFSSTLKDGSTDKDSFAYMQWNEMVSNTNYESQLGEKGYAIPITKTDAVCGKLELTIWTPRHWPYNNGTNVHNDRFLWYQFAPCVFMKDFDVKYCYTDETPWWLYKHQNDTDDVKYVNDTKDIYKYTKEETLKINSWQDQRPISKSFPIIRFDNNNTEVCEYLDKTIDASNYDTKTKQENQIISRQLRHFAEPRKKYTCHRKSFYAPYSKIQLSDASELEGIFVVGAQEYDIRNRNNTVELIEFGDAQIYT